LTSVAAVTLSLGPVAATAAPPTPDFGASIDAYAAYDGQDTCDPTPKPGVVDVKNLLEAEYGHHEWGIARDCGIGGTSEHKEGRALDYGFDVFDSAQRADAEDVLNWLLSTDRHGNQHAVARRLGVMYIIWNRRIWKAYQASQGWQSYDGSNPHTDHIHISFSWAGARQRTSWWSAGPTTPPGPTDNGVGAVVYDSVLRTFARGGDGALWQAYQFDGAWHWQEIGGQIVGNPSPVVSGGILRVFARGINGTLWQAYYANGQWTWQDLGGQIAGGPGAVEFGGALRVFARGTDNALWQAFYTDRWTWQKIGGVITSPPGTVVHDGRLRVFARGNDGALWQASYTDQWQWQTIGGQVSSGPAAYASGTTLRVFARGGNGALWQAIYTDRWQWQEIGGQITGGPGAVEFGGASRVFARGLDGALWQASYAGQWQWQTIGGYIV
jgi:hypothetical protein